MAAPWHITCFIRSKKETKHGAIFDVRLSSNPSWG